ncbi:hypothetical protein CR513_05204, partial [Mucuna pruriens]
MFRGRGRGRGRQPFNKAIIECFKCHKLGHFQYECPSWENGANYAKVDEEVLLMPYVELNHCKREEVWFLDFECNLDDQFRQNMRLDNNSRMEVMGKGNVRIQENGIPQVIFEVYYILELKINLLSVGKLQEKGVAILIQHGK